MIQAGCSLKHPTVQMEIFHKNEMYKLPYVRVRVQGRAGKRKRGRRKICGGLCFGLPFAWW